MEKKNIVILGAGFGGLRVAMDLAHGLGSLKLLDKYAITLVDRTNCHLFTPLLYKLAAAPDQPPECTYDTTTLIKGLPVQFVEREAGAVDLMGGKVKFANGDGLTMDYLVIAIGSETNFFGITGLKENALQLKTAESAALIRDAITKLFENGGEKKILVGGAGANGIELGAEIRLWANQAQKEKSGLKVSVDLLEATPTVLPGLDPRVQAIATKRLGMLNIGLTTNAKIVSVAPKEVSLDGGRKIPFDLFIWTGGVKSPEMLTQLPLEKEARGRTIVKAGMECLPATPDLRLSPMVYGLGDSVCYMNATTGRPVPAIAPAAIDQGEVVAHNILEEIKKAERPGYVPRPRAYVPHDYPYVIPIGEGWAVTKYGSFVFSGWPAWAFAKLVEVRYLLSIMSFREAMQAWGKTR